jgi:hypothetical protein
MELDMSMALEVWLLVISVANGAHSCGYDSNGNLAAWVETDVSIFARYE